MKLLKRHWPTLLGAALGALGGYLYWYFVGCADARARSPPRRSTARCGAPSWADCC